MKNQILTPVIMTGLLFVTVDSTKAAEWTDLTELGLVRQALAPAGLMLENERYFYYDSTGSAGD